MAGTVVEQPPPPLPEGWTANTDPTTGNVFYHSTATGETTWTRPVGAPTQVLQSHFPLPDEWCEYIDPNTGGKYYHCAATGETTWERPVPGPPMACRRVPEDKVLPGLPGAFISYLKKNPQILESIRAFQSQHQQHFAGQSSDEWALGATSSYNQFVELIDAYLQPFLVEQGVTAEAFAESVQQLQTTNRANFYAFSLMLQRLDFPEFANLMRSNTCLCCGGFFMGVDLEGAK